MIKVITVVRRKAKSYLLFELFNNYLLNNNVDSEHIIKFAFDSQDYLDLIGEDLLDINIKKRKFNPKKFNDYIKSRITDKDMYYILLGQLPIT